MTPQERHDLAALEPATVQARDADRARRIEELAQLADELGSYELERAEASR